MVVFLFFSSFTGSTVDDYEFGAFKHYPNNLVSPDSTNTLRLNTNNNDLNSYQHNNSQRLNGFSRSNSPSRTFGIDATLANNLPNSPAHMEHLFSSKLQAERLLLELTYPKEQVCDLKQPTEHGVLAKQHLRRGTRFGPFAITDAAEKSNAWDVSHYYHYYLFFCDEYL